MTKKMDKTTYHDLNVIDAELTAVAEALDTVIDDLEQMHSDLDEARDWLDIILVAEAKRR